MNTFWILVGLVALAFLALNLLARRKMNKLAAVSDHETILTLTELNFQESIKGKLVLIDFWASWCAPCRMMAPILNDLAAELTGNRYVGKINIEEQEVLAHRFKIRSIPTLVLLKDGVEVGRVSGIKTKDYLLKMMENLK